jgi:hypothetical protein
MRNASRNAGSRSARAFTVSLNSLVSGIFRGILLGLFFRTAVTHEPGKNPPARRLGEHTIYDCIYALLQA